jgi:excinuclease UvrABC nuclease subunit
MENAAQDLDFLQAARYRDELAELKIKVEKMEAV